LSRPGFILFAPVPSLVLSSGSVSWTLTWTAPSQADAVVFHATANAAIFDASEFGDFVYTAQRHSNASDGSE